MTESADLVNTARRLVEILSALGISYHVTGGLSVILYSQPRTTLDIDVVVDASAVQAHFDQFLAECRPVFMFNPEALRDAIRRNGIFQLLDTATGFKIDLYLREGVPGELGRSVLRELVPGFPIRVVSLEDAVLSKLIWIRKGSHRSRRDVRWLVSAVPPEQIPSLRGSASDLGLLSLLDEVLAEEEPRE